VIGAYLSVEEAVRVAEAHYRAIVEGDREAWLRTLALVYRERADVRGSSADFWWRAGRRMAEKGVTYVFDRVDRVEEDYVKLFFRRLDADGRQLGMPVPIHLRLEKDGWRVEQPSY